MPHRHLRASACLTALAVLTLVPSALAMPWEAAPVAALHDPPRGSGGGIPLEAGELGRAQLQFANIGEIAWDRAAGVNVNLGTTCFPSPGFREGCRDRVSPFYVPATWLGPNRPTRVTEDKVEPDVAVGTFSYSVRAPAFTSPDPGEICGTHHPESKQYKEYVAPVADGQADGWMDERTGVFFPYCVHARTPPSVTIDSLTERVVTGEPISVLASASDNVRLSRVTFSIDGRDLLTLDGSRLSKDLPARVAAELGSSGLPVGARTLTVRAYDGVDQVAVAEKAFLIVPLPDRDRDQIPDSRDVCPAAHRGGFDRNGNGCPGPFRRIVPRPDAVQRLTKQYTFFRSFSITNLPARRRGVAVSLRCRKGCSFRWTRSHVKRRVKLKPLIRRRLKLGTVIGVRITAPGYIGYASQLKTIRSLGKVRAIEANLRCIPAGSGKPRRRGRRCPRGR